MTPEADKSSPPSGSGAEVTTETTPMSNSRGRKRVRFDEAPPAVRERSPEQQEDTEVETISLDIDEVCGIKKRRGADAVRTRLPGVCMTGGTPGDPNWCSSLMQRILGARLN
eukprot:scaffold113617_cov21-Tisochrysis_lutea.AAC.2